MEYLGTRIFHKDAIPQELGEPLVVGDYMAAIVGGDRVIISTVVEVNAESVVWQTGDNKKRCFFDGRMSIEIESPVC